MWLDDSSDFRSRTDESPSLFLDQSAAYCCHYFGNAPSTPFT
ncbi:hypothetical protein GW12_12490 [Acinetobacter sp. HR7]|nr:hypothetical protein GW12_12490 [Acinetobacter sp. HR7]